MNWKSLVGILILFLFLAGCLGSNNSNSMGTLTGKITIGPLCPVEGLPQQEDPCLPTLETFQAYPLVVIKNGIQVTEFVGNAQGDYSLSLPAGTYTIQTKRQGLGSFPPTEVVIEAGKLTTFNIDIDTGIR